MAETPKIGLRELGQLLAKEKVKKLENKEKPDTIEFSKSK